MSTHHESFSAQLGQLAARISVAWATVFGLIVLTVVYVVLAVGGIYLLTHPDATSPVGTSRSVFGEEISSNHLLSIPVVGELAGKVPSDDADRLTDTVYGYEIKDQLVRAAKDDNIRGVILEIDSPGGAIYGATAIADGVKYYREKTKRPVFAHISGLAASGGYWVAASADRILADVGSSLGSIGVLQGPFKYYDKVLSETHDTGTVVTQNGIQSVTIAAGKGKTTGDPYQKLTAEEVTILQQSVNNDYAVFVNYVADRRRIDPALVRSQIGAYVYGTQAAKANRLIDAESSREEAYQDLAKAAKLTDDDYNVIVADPLAAADASASVDPFTAVATWLGVRRAAAPATPAPSAGRAHCAVGPQAFYGDPARLCE